MPLRIMTVMPADVTDLRAESFRGNLERFSAFAAAYDRFRPGPPDALAELVRHFGDLTRLPVVMDLGSGTGLSARYWAARADRVVGVEPSADMRAGVRRHARLQCLLSGRPQSLHWMVAQPTFEESARVLIDGGVFAAGDYDWRPMSGAWQADVAFEQCLGRARELERDLQLSDRLWQWDKAERLARMSASGCFRYVREAVLHQADVGNAERLVGLLLSQGGTMDLLKARQSEEQLGVDELRRVATDTLGKEPRPWFWSARIRLGIV